MVVGGVALVAVVGHMAKAAKHPFFDKMAMLFIHQMMNRIFVLFLGILASMGMPLRKVQETQKVSHVYTCHKNAFEVFEAPQEKKRHETLFRYSHSICLVLARMANRFHSSCWRRCNRPTSVVQLPYGHRAASSPPAGAHWRGCSCNNAREHSPPRMTMTGSV